MLSLRRWRAHCRPRSAGRPGAAPVCRAATCPRRMTSRVEMAWGPEPLRDLRRGVGVHLDQLDLAGQVAGELLERGADHAAGPAPGRPQAGEDRDLGGLGDLTEGRVVGVSDPRQRLMALAAAGRPGRCGRHPVGLAAVPAPDKPASHGFMIPVGAGVAACQRSAGTPRTMRPVAPSACSSAMPVMTVPCASPPWGCAWCAARSAGQASRCRQCAAGSGPCRPPHPPSGSWRGWRQGRRSPWRCRRTRGR